MRVLIQRVLQAQVEVEGSIIGNIGPGLLAFIGVTHGDTLSQGVWLANKLVNLRIFNDESLLEYKGEVLVVSQFTLYADCSAGRRPSYTQAAQPDVAKQPYELFVEELRKAGVVVKTGIFGADMKVSLVNDGPVTILLDK